MDHTAENILLLQSYQALAAFLCESFDGPCSTALYRIDEKESESVVVAAYGEKVDRKRGDPITPFLQKVVQSLRKSGAPGLTHVDTEASTSDGRVKLNIFAIRNSCSELIGLFIICTEIDLLYSIRETVNRYLGYQSTDDTPIKAPSSVENAMEGTISLSEYMQQLIQDEIAAFGVPVNRMTMEEKQNLVHRLEALEVFFVKDSVKITANLLGVSVPTVYRLLKRERKEI